MVMPAPRAAGHLGSQDGAGRSERRLARSTEREAELRDVEEYFEYFELEN